MSEIQPNMLVRNRFEFSSGRTGEWSTLRLLVYRDRTEMLTVCLVEQPRNGHPRMDSRIRGLQFPWDPAKAEGDLRLYALNQALLGVAQTGR